MYALMIVPSDFPNGDAGAVRDDAFAQIYQELGYDVFLVGKSKSNPKGKYNETDYISIYKNIPGLRGHIYRGFNEHKDYEKAIREYITKHGMPSLIHLNSIPEKTISFLIDIAEKCRIPILHDSVEWYSACEFSHGRFDKAYILKDRLNRKVIKQPIRVIGISSYLTEHFMRRGLRAVRIPVIMNVEITKISVNRDEKVKLIYAGSPANKDYLREIVLGVKLLSEIDQKRLELHILGATKEQIKELTGSQALPACIKPYGRVPREKVEEVMLQMDFSVLLRPSEERYTKAGFPTKSVEAMSHGVAMICNISSDLGMYLRDGENAVIVDGYNEKDFKRSLERVLSMSRTQINVIKSNARQLAEKEFDYRNWVKTVSDFIGDK